MPFSVTKLSGRIPHWLLLKKTLFWQQLSQHIHRSSPVHREVGAEQPARPFFQISKASLGPKGRVRSHLLLDFSSTSNTVGRAKLKKDKSQPALYTLSLAPGPQ